MGETPPPPHHPFHPLLPHLCLCLLLMLLRIWCCIYLCLCVCVCVCVCACVRAHHCISCLRVCAYRVSASLFTQESNRTLVSPVHLIIKLFHAICSCYISVLFFLFCSVLKKTKRTNKTTTAGYHWCGLDLICCHWHLLISTSCN